MKIYNLTNNDGKRTTILDIMFERYNKWNRLEWKELQDFVDNLIQVWVEWIETVDYEELKEKFIASFTPKRISKDFKIRKFNALRLMYWPKFINNNKHEQ